MCGLALLWKFPGGSTEGLTVGDRRGLAGVSARAGGAGAAERAGGLGGLEQQPGNWCVLPRPQGTGLSHAGPQCRWWTEVGGGAWRTDSGLPTSLLY